MGIVKMFKMDQLLYVLIIIAIFTSEGLGFSIRHKRQAQGNAARSGCTGNNCTPTQTPRLLTTDECMKACTVTSEYNPICGTNNVLYSNPGRLLCARDCGVDVQMRGPAPCTQQTSTAAAPSS